MLPLNKYARCLLMVVMMLSSTFAIAQLNITSGVSPQQLVQQLVGNGIQVSNVTLGPQTSLGQVGSFTNSGTNLPLSQGILLSTGWANDVAISGNNTNGSFTSQGINCPVITNGLCLPGDADLTNIVGTNTFDAAILEFDFVPLADTVKFRYVFASEEYPEYNCSQFNDVFAFIMSGPGFPAQNIALIPGTSTTVEINTINNGTVGINGSISNCTPPTGTLANSSMYIDNQGGAGLQYDGMTQIFEAVAVVQPCSTYHIKLAVADADDGAFDSGVFLEAGSFFSDALDVTTTTQNNDSIIVEGCNDGQINIRLQHPTPNNLAVSYTTWGDAQAGSDYTFSTNTWTIPTGSDVLTIDIFPTNDNVVDGVDTLYIEIQSSICKTDTVVFYIREEILLPPPILTCDTANAVSVTYTWASILQASAYAVSINNGVTWDTIGNVTQYTMYGLSSNMPYEIQVRGVGGYSICTPHYADTLLCFTKECLLVGSVDSLAAISCFGYNDGYVRIVADSGTAPYSYALDGNGSQLSNEFTGLTPGNHTVEIIDGDSCRFLVNFSINEPPPIQIFIDSLNGTTCHNTSDGSISFSATSGAGSYLFSLDSASSGSPSSDFNNLEGGNYTIYVTDANGCVISQPFAIPSPDSIRLTTFFTPPTCHGASDGSAIVTATGGTPNYTFQWQHGSQTSVLNNIAAGQYFVTVADANGCTDTTSVIVTQPDPLAFTNITINPTACNGGGDGSIFINVSGGTQGYSYNWSPIPSNQPFLQNIPAGDYSVTVTDVNGCTLDTMLTVTEPQALGFTSVNISPISCFGYNDGTISVIPNDSTVSYFWLPSGQGTATVTNLSPGNHTVLITNANGCQHRDTFLIQEPTPITGLLIEDMGASCFGANDGIASAFGSGGTPGFLTDYTFQWNTIPPQNASTAYGLQGGQTYTVTITDSLGCFAMDSITISQPAMIMIEATSIPVNCHKGNDGMAIADPDGGTPPFTYQWGANANFQTTDTAFQLSQGIYNVTVTDLAGCTATSSVTVLQPDPLFTAITHEDVVCFGDNTGSATLSIADGTPPYSIQWDSNTGNATNERVFDLFSGWYIVTVTDAGGCILTDSIFINQPDLPISPTIAVEDATCFGERDGQIEVTTMGGKRPYQYSINGQIFNNANFFAGLYAGDYTLRIKDDEGCILDTTLVVTQPQEMQVSAGADREIFYGESSDLIASVINGIAPLTYLWTPSETLSCDNCQLTIAAPLDDQQYFLQVIDSSGCLGEDNVWVRVANNRVIYVATGFSPNGDFVNDFLFVQGDEQVANINLFAVYDRWGEEVFKTENILVNVAETGWDGTFKGQPMNHGMYIWKAEVTFVDGERLFFSGQANLVR